MKRTMRRESRRCFLWMFALCLSTGPSLAQNEGASPNIAEIQRLFQTPPDDARIMMRWWWFGSAVTAPELQREILAMKAGGVGGFEIQPVYPLALDDPATGFRNLPYLSQDFLDAVSFASTVARKNNMRVDMTLASGWPYGGPHVPVTQAAGRLRLVTLEVPAETSSLPLPNIGNGEALIAMFVGEGSAADYETAKLKQIEARPMQGRVTVVPQPASRVALFFISSRTGQQVKRPAIGADGFVLDHFDKAAIDTHLLAVGERLMQAFGDHPPYAVFSDSLEVYGSDWTADFISEFRKRRGYDLTPHLPELMEGTSEEARAVRHDWGRTLTELIDERYLGVIDSWAKAHHTRFRSQTYGEPAVSLSSNNLVALPEGEGPQWREFSFTRWATSASHLYGRPVTSAETWTWLHSPAFRATPLDMKAEADLFFLEGVNQLIGHGWPYSPPEVAEPGWAFYAAAVFNDHNPWWMVMPDITKYLQRVSCLLRQGEPANDIAVLLPNDDAYTEFTPGHVALSAEMKKYITPVLTGQILDNGYGFDYIDAEAIEHVGIRHAVLILPHVERLSPEVTAKIVAYAEHGGKVIAIGTMPSRAPGLVHAQELSDEVRAQAAKLFMGDHARGQLIASDEALGAALKTALRPDLELTTGAAQIGFIHRKVADADIYFLANTSNHDVHTSARFRSSRKTVLSWDPFSGNTVPTSFSPVALDLAPYESKIIVFSDKASPASAPAASIGKMEIADLSGGWKLEFKPLHLSREMKKLASWTDDERTLYYSGVASYTKDLVLTSAQVNNGTLTIDFGSGTPVQPDSRQHNGTRALLESPIREAAVVFVNGQRAGSVWHPPYALDITSRVHEGKNHVEIHVANLAINELAGRTLPDYRLLNARYGQRFIPQDTESLRPQPSGMLGPVRLFLAKGK